jgi:hypothetical protein
VKGLLARLDAAIVSTFRTERRVRRALAAAAAGGGPIVAEAWPGESGYEGLYWVPFLRWAADRYGVAPNRLTAIAHARMDPWYAGIASRVIHPSDEDARPRHAAVWSPGMMLDLFAGFWSGKRSLDFLSRHTDYRYAVLPAAPRPDVSSTARYAAVELYTGGTIANTPANRSLLQAVTDRIAARMPVVTVDGSQGPDTMRVISGATQFIGTSGGLAWLAPFAGVNTIAIHGTGGEMSTHLYAARYAYRKSRAARFSVLNIDALRAAGCALDITA